MNFRRRENACTASMRQKADRSKRPQQKAAAFEGKRPPPPLFVLSTSFLPNTCVYFARFSTLCSPPAPTTRVLFRFYIGAELPEVTEISPFIRYSSISYPEPILESPTVAELFSQHPCWASRQSKSVRLFEL